LKTGYWRREIHHAVEPRLHAKIGIPLPEVMAHFVAVLEIVGGVLRISGFLTRLIAIPFVIEMVVAILSTKVALYLGTSPLPLPPAPPQIGAVSFDDGSGEVGTGYG
jgi:hypothetical protein